MTTTRPRLVIWGASGHARVVADIVRLAAQYDLVGFLDDVSPERAGSSFAGAQVVGSRERLPELRASGVTHLIVAIGDCDVRLALSDLARSAGFELAAAIHPSAVVAGDVRCGAGLVVAAGAVVNPGTTLGAAAIVNTSASVDHDCIIGAGVHVCPGVHVAGHVTVGEGTWLGIGATVIDRVEIGAHTFVGAGAVVTRSLPDRVFAAGVPARVVKRRD